MKLPKISLGSAVKKRYTRDMSFDCNTTMNFGFCEPLMSQRLEPKATINVDYRQFVRLAPMPVPTFGRVSLYNEVMFCPISDIVPYYDAMLANQSYYTGAGVAGYTPTTLPYTTNCLLLYFLLCNYSEWTVYNKDTSASDGSYNPDTQGDNTDQLDFWRICNISKSVNFPIGVSLPKYCKLNTSNYATGNPDAGTLEPGNMGAVTFDGADYVYCSLDGTQSKYFCFRLSNTGRRLRKIFIGLGYSLEVSDNSPVSIVPLLAYYKCWFDRFAPKRSENFMMTNCYHLIKIIETENKTKFDFSIFGTSTDVTNVVTVLWQFISKELSQTWYAAPDDFISAHRDSPNEGAAMPKIDYYDNNNDSVQDENELWLSKPALDATQSTSLSNVTLQILQRYTRFINKNSVIGKKLDDYLRVHYGASISNSLYKSAYSISRSRVNVEIGDVFSTSDTADTSSKTGEFLGSYAGKGTGFSKTGFKFTAPSAGYLFVMSCIVPDAGTFQGNSADLYALDVDTIPNPDFDAVGYEITPRGMLVTHNDLCLFGQKSILNSGFGFMPRYSSFKFRKNVVNGDMSRRGSIDSFSPYYLDRRLIDATITAKKKSTGAYIIETHFGDVPNSSVSWRYPCRYDWLGNFNRIFYEDTGYDVVSTDNKLIDDHFIIQSVFSVKVTDFLKPMSQSYDTFEESVDKGTISVKMD